MEYTDSVHDDFVIIMKTLDPTSNKLKIERTITLEKSSPVVTVKSTYINQQHGTRFYEPHSHVMLNSNQFINSSVRGIVDNEWQKMPLKSNDNFYVGHNFNLDSTNSKGIYFESRKPSVALFHETHASSQVDYCVCETSVCTSGTCFFISKSISVDSDASLNAISSEVYSGGVIFGKAKGENGLPIDECGKTAEFVNRFSILSDPVAKIENMNTLTIPSETFSYDNQYETDFVSIGGPDGSQCIQTVARHGTTPPCENISWDFGELYVEPTDFIRFNNAVKTNDYYFDLNITIDKQVQTVPTVGYQPKNDAVWSWNKKAFGICYEGMLSSIQIYKNNGFGDAVYRLDDFEVVNGNYLKTINDDFATNPSNYANHQLNDYNYQYDEAFGNGDNSSMNAVGQNVGYFYYINKHLFENEGYTVAVDVYREDDWDSNDRIEVGFYDTYLGHITKSYYESDIPVGTWTTVYATFSNNDNSTYSVKPGIGIFAKGKRVSFDNMKLYTTSQPTVLSMENCNVLNDYNDSFLADNMEETKIVGNGGPDGSSCIETIARYNPEPDYDDLEWIFKPINVESSDFIRFKNAAKVNDYNYDINVNMGDYYKKIPHEVSLQSENSFWKWQEQVVGICYSGELKGIQIHKNDGFGDAIYRIDDLEILKGKQKNIVNGDFAIEPSSNTNQWNPGNYSYSTSYGGVMSSSATSNGYFYSLNNTLNENEGYTLAIDVHRQDDWSEADFIEIGFYDSGSEGHVFRKYYANDILAGNWSTLYITYLSNEKTFSKKPGIKVSANGKEVLFDNMKLFTTEK